MHFNDKKWRVILIVLISIAVIPVAQFIWQACLFDSVSNAVKKGDIIQVQRLLRIGANPNAHGGGLSGGTALVFATDKSDLKMMQLLIKAGADVNEKDSGYTPLMYSRTPQAAQLLLDVGANSKIRSDDGLTAWQLMRYRKFTKIAQVIMKHDNKNKR